MERNEHNPPTHEQVDEPVFTAHRLAELSTYLRAALRRHRVMFFLVLVGVLGLGIALGVALPQRWESQARVLEQRTFAMSALANPDRTVPMAAQDPLLAVGAYVLTRDTLERIAQEAGLRESFETNRSDLLRLKDRARAFVAGPLTDAEFEDAIVTMLEDRVSVTADEEGLIHFAASWYDATAATRIVDLLVQTFLERRRAETTGAIQDTLAVLERHIEDDRQEVATDLAGLRRARARWARSHKAGTAGPMMEADGEKLYGSTLESDLARVDSSIESKRAAITQVEAMRAQRLAELTATLNERSTVLGPRHPEIRNLKESIRLFRADSPELGRLRAEERSLLNEQRRLEGRADETLGRRNADRLRLARAALEAVDPGEMLDPEVAYARAKLESSLVSYEDMRRRVASTRIELDTSRAAFPYRYAVVSAPRAPREPASPGLAVFVIAGLLAGTFLGLVAVAGAELAGGRLLVPWQVERELGLAYMGEVKET